MLKRPSNAARARSRVFTVKGIAREQFIADWPALAVDDKAHDHLDLFKLAVLAKAEIPQGIGAHALEREGGDVVKDHVDLHVEQVAVGLKQRFLQFGYAQSNGYQNGTQRSPKRGPAFGPFSFCAH